MFLLLVVKTVATIVRLWTIALHAALQRGAAVMYFLYLSLAGTNNTVRSNLLRRAHGGARVLARGRYRG